MSIRALVAVAFPICLVAACAGPRPLTTGPGIAGDFVRVGVFQRTEVLVAYYASEVHAQYIHSLAERRDQALTAGNAALAGEIEAEGGASQEFAHRQLTGEATLTNINAALKPFWSDIAERADVSLIVEQPLFDAKEVELVDVTDVIIAHLRPADP